MSMTISELFGTKDIFEDCRRKADIFGSNSRISAELILKNGDRRIYRAKSIDKTFAIREILTFVAAVEEATGESVMWRLKGDNQYHYSINYVAKPSLLQRAKKNLLKYFFEIEE
ncbi:DUF6018 family natural product bioysynthesis protein [Neobacillus sp.]|uniref:DUF6018 family natural product bioysynthesis protein n=1 Tax=Neobacillus sp. TaxID=2675273 RepID=UPI0035B52F43